jgi:Dolichyl-phosphate-mannose-protein mannosyltransferase/F5/8 type C domain
VARGIAAKTLPWAALVAILALAAALRLVGLSSGLRHIPHQDERYLVENASWMLARGDLDHRFYEYPGLMFYLLGPVLAFLERGAPGPAAYLAARGVVAAFGVTSVALTFALGTRVVGKGPALAAALLIAVCPIEVQTAHMVRPDVVLETFVLLAFVAFERVDAGRRGDALAGAAMGAAVALKFTGVLLAPCYVLRRLLAPRPSEESMIALVTRILLAAAIACSLFMLLSPYSILHFDAALAGARTQVTYHYVERGRGPQAFLGMAATYGLLLFRAMGWLGAALIVAGAVRAIRDWRRWAPLLAFPVLTVAVFSTAEVHHERFLVPTLGILAIVAALPIEAVARFRTSAAWLLALLAAVHPLRLSMDYVSGISQPGTKDLALDWIESNVAEGSRILTSVRDLGIDRRRYEVLAVDRLDERTRTLALDVDVVVSANEEADLAGQLEMRHRETPATIHSGLEIRIAAAKTPRDVRFRRLDLDRRWVTTSESTEAASALVDGDPSTAWRTEAAQRPGTWIEIRLPSASVVARIETRLAGRRQFARNLHLYVTEDGHQWRRIAVMQGRPPVDEQVGEASQLLLFEPIRVCGLRLVQVGERERPWAVAELSIWALR